MRGSEPRVSIVIPVYNGANYLREAIDSALAQTYENREVIVVNDGSTDAGATEAIAESYGDRIRYFAKPNGGVSTALNVGLREMTGEYFAWLSHDDLFVPGKLAVQVARITREPDDVVLYGDYELVDATGRSVGVRRVEPVADSMRTALITGDPVNGCTTLVSRAALEREGGFDPTLRTTQDYDLWFRLTRRHRFVHQSEILLRSRLHPEQGGRTIPTHLAERDATFARFIAALTPADAAAARPAPPSIFYARLALQMKLRGYDGAAAEALSLAARHGEGDGGIARLERLGVALACSVLTRKMKPGYWISRLQARRRA